MKAAQVIKYGDEGAIVIHDVPKPPVTEGKVLIEVYAAGINPIDWKVRSGYMRPRELPFTLGGDLSGIVMEVGKGVSGIKKGDAVYGMAGVWNGGSGSFAEFDLADSKTISLKPGGISHAEAGALPLAGVSALQALAEHIKLSKGQKILIHGGSGGIGSFAVQAAKHIGAYVAATVSAKNADFLKGLGADMVIDYKNEKFEDLVKDYDAVFDTVGGDTYKRSFEVLKKGGVIVSMLEGPDNELMERYGVNAMGQFTQVTSNRLQILADFVVIGAIRVHIDREFPLEEAAQAVSYLEKGHPKGKVVIRIK